MPPSPAQRRWLLWALLCLGGVLLHPPRVHGPINPQDEGIWLAFAQVLHDGGRLYRDVALYYGPLTVLALKPVCGAGMTLSRVRGTFGLLNLLGLWAVFAVIVRRIERPTAAALAALAAALVPFAAHIQVIPYAFRYGAGFLPMLLWEESPGAAGLCAGLAYWISEEVGAAALAAGLVATGLFGGRKASVRFFLGGAAVLAAGLAVIAWRDGLSYYWSSSVSDLGVLMARLSRPLPAWPSPFAAGEAATFLAARLPLLTYAAVGALFFAPAFKDAPRRKFAAAAALYGLLASVSGLVRSDRWHVYFSLTPAILLWGTFADALWEDRSSRRTAAAAAAGFLGLALVLPHVFPAVERERVYVLTCLRTRLPRAGGARLPLSQAVGYGMLGDWVDAHVAPGEPFFYYPFNAAAYFMTDRPNPCRLSLSVDAGREPQRLDLIRELDRARVRWVVWDKQQTSFDGVPLDDLLSPIGGYVRGRYRKADALGPWEFWERLPDAAGKSDLVE